jgi:glycosyltransferase involved in cell wall biosynthesis
MLKKRYSIDTVTKLLYVGRVSDEKNLPLLADVFLRLAARRPDLHLIVVGDGPYRRQMEARLAGAPCTFTGCLDGEDLAEVYASSDILVFPSATDTFGNVVLEAQASGIPVIVSDRGGPAENVIPDVTGLVLPAGDAQSLYNAVWTLADNPRRMRDMGLQARRYMEGRSFDQAFVQSWQMFESSRGGPQGRRHTAPHTTTADSAAPC